jgi:hypothetical protein
MGGITPIRSITVPPRPSVSGGNGPQLNTVAPMPTEITPEIVAVIQAAAREFVGKPIRLLSIRILSESARCARPWQDQGRNIHQESHNLVQRRH